MAFLAATKDTSGFMHIIVSRLGKGKNSLYRYELATATDIATVNKCTSGYYVYMVQT